LSCAARHTKNNRITHTFFINNSKDYFRRFFMSVSNTSVTEWSKYITPFFAASVAIVPAIYGFIAKSALQAGGSAPRMQFRACLIEGLKASPTVGTMVGIQQVAEEIVEEKLQRVGWDKTDFSTMLFSTVTVGAVSAPLLAIFNGQTMGWNPTKSLRMLSVKQGGAIICRESAFLLGLRLSDPVAGAMQRELGESKVVDYTAAFFSGGAGSFIGHPADTLLTLWQRGEKLQRWSHLMRGAAHKAVAVGIFSVCYRAALGVMSPGERNKL
jgi:hypothetical protein